MGNSFKVDAYGEDFPREKKKFPQQKVHGEYRWRIEEFSSYLLQPQARDVRFASFQFGGYDWYLSVSVRGGYLSLFLFLDSCPGFGCLIYAEFKFYVFDQSNNLRLEYKVESHFLMRNDDFGLNNIMTLEEFQQPCSGFLVNDTCIFGVEFVQVQTRRIINLNGLLGNWYIHEKPPSHKLKWTIQQFSKIQGPRTSSENFSVGGHVWNLEIYPYGTRKNDCLEIYLRLITTSPKSELGVEYCLQLMDQINYHVTNFTGEGRADEENSLLPSWEYPLRDFHNPSNGFLVNDTCIIEVSVTIFSSCPKP